MPNFLNKLTETFFGNSDAKKSAQEETPKVDPRRLELSLIQVQSIGGSGDNPESKWVLSSLQKPKGPMNMPGTGVFMEVYKNVNVNKGNNQTCTFRLSSTVALNNLNLLESKQTPQNFTKGANIILLCPDKIEDLNFYMEILSKEKFDGGLKQVMLIPKNQDMLKLFVDFFQEHKDSQWQIALTTLNLTEKIKQEDILNILYRQYTNPIPVLALDDPEAKRDAEIREHFKVLVLADIIIEYAGAIEIEELEDVCRTNNDAAIKPGPKVS